MPNETPKILNIGSGNDKSVPGSITLDRSPLVKPDILHDLGQFPWPFEDNSFDEIHCRDVLEHLEDLLKTMEEIHRIAKNGAKVYITTPHYSCSNSFTDPTHCKHLGFFSLDYFTDENQWGFYTKARFKKNIAKIAFASNLKNVIIRRIANKWPAFYEEHLAFIFPAWFLDYELEVMK